MRRAVALAVHVPESARLYWLGWRRKFTPKHDKSNWNLPLKWSWCLKWILLYNPSPLNHVISDFFLCYCCFSCSCYMTEARETAARLSPFINLFSYLCLLCPKLLLFWMFPECTVHYLMCTFPYCVINKMFYDPGNHHILVSSVSHYLAFGSPTMQRVYHSHVKM